VCKIDFRLIYLGTVPSEGHEVRARALSTEHKIEREIGNAAKGIAIVDWP